MLPGTRDPYAVTGHGGGFVMVWRNGVQWNIWKENDPQKFMTVDSGDYLLAIPDLSHEARRAPENAKSTPQEYENSSLSSMREGATFKKVVMKLSGKVRWLVGLVFERNLEGGGRSFDFEPHYHVTLKNPAHVKPLKVQAHLPNSEKTYDAFRGFRSNHIHMSVGILAPSDRDWMGANNKDSPNYNAIHLTPRFFTHFYAWWAMFSGAMSLPVRQGKLFPGVEKSGKKFGRHLATVKYSLLFAPLFIAHVYKHKDGDEYQNDEVSATGLKLRLDSFLLDLHQRREEFKSKVKGMHKTITTSGMRVNQTFLDLTNPDLRAMSAIMTGTSAEAVAKASGERLADYGETPRTIDLSKFEIPDNDFSWIDVDDLVEIDWSLPTDANPETKILPLVYAPRFTYKRNTDHENAISGDANRHSPFGYEDTHGCIMAVASDPRKIQLKLIKARLEKIDEFISLHDRNTDEQELHTIRERESDSQGMHEKLGEMRDHSAILRRKRHFLHKMQQNLEERLADGDRRVIAAPEEVNLEQSTTRGADDTFLDNDTATTKDIFGIDKHDDVGNFNNRFVIHNAQIKWNNALRNIMLRYIHQVSQRRGFVYYTSRRAVKFILDIVEEQNKHKHQTQDDSNDSRQSDADTPPSLIDHEEDETVQDRIQQLLADAQKFVDADDPEDANGNYRKSSSDEKSKEKVAEHFIVQNTYHVRLVAPQIQLQSEKNTKAAILLTARGMRLRVLQIMDKERIYDDVSGLVQRRFAAEMDNMQFFVSTRQNFSTEHLHMYSGTRYGTPTGSSWPPWVPIEVMFDFDIQPVGFSRVVQRTSATLRYDKFNNLRLKYNDNVYRRQSFAGPSEPLEKTRNERLEKIMLASDFSDLRGAPELVMMLQSRIRQLEEIKTHFHIHEKYLDRQGWQDRVHMEQDLASCEDELFFMMKAITTAQRKSEERTDGSQVNGLMKWYLSSSEIVWHLTKDADQPLMEFQLNRASFEKTDNSDGSTHSAVEIERIHGLNLLPNAIYPEIIAAYDDPIRSHPTPKDTRMIRVIWLMLEAIAGIPVVDHFEVDLHPLKVQLEYESGKQLFSYVFPGTGDG
ncbi:hypothetical protein MRB53_039745 [Persea americana]|nr:hypothetical protein MRB53_039745 [Persea americana]